MTSRRQYLIAYDISDDKRRTAVFKLLMGQGDHVQFSVFLCSLNETELARVRGRLAELIHARDDQVIFVDLGLAENKCAQLFDCLGKPYNPPSRVQVI
ncbi:MAG: CRISPR-associated endonuclease Cas2 [Phycisphaerae bacterium]|nr:CRISPR-associated endonuclease Cas2 [Phycisphaerae bacterium]